MSPRASGTGPGSLLPPLPGAEPERLSRRQGLIAWVIGSVLGIAVATALLLVLAPRLT
jgi:hypothetical protein